jgi:hypothetical protein
MAIKLANFILILKLLQAHRAYVRCLSHMFWSFLEFLLTNNLHYVIHHWLSDINWQTTIPDILRQLTHFNLSLIFSYNPSMLSYKFYTPTYNEHVVNGDYPATYDTDDQAE